MALFNEKILRKAVTVPAAIPEEHRQIVERWAKLVRSHEIELASEVSLQGDFRATIIEALLGYRGRGHDSGWTVDSERSMGSGKVDLALGKFDESETVIVPLELKGASTRDLDAPMPGRKISPVEQVWRYSNSAKGVKWVLISNMLEIRLYAYAEGNQNYQRFDLARIDDPEVYARMLYVLSAGQLLGKSTEALLAASRTADKDISNQLYLDYRSLRENLIIAIRQSHTALTPVEAIGAAQTILDRVLFVAFAEDRGLLPEHSLRRAFEHSDPYNPHPVWENFKGLFRSIDVGNEVLGIPKYNGGLFRRDQHILDLDLSDEVCGGFRKLGEYDYGSEVDVTILGHIFEQSISDIELQLKRARGEEQGDFANADPLDESAPGRKKRDGIVYTPDYIARFIVDKTLGRHIDELFCAVMSARAKSGDPNDYATLRFTTGKAKPDTERKAAAEAWMAYRQQLQALRVVDPACGSGVFLVTAFHLLKSEYDRVNKKIAELRGVGGTAADFFDIDAEILSRNLYGVDVNSESIEITKLSLWLTTARRGKELDSLDRTIRVGDSLIEDSNYAYLKHGFEWQTAFPAVFADGGFDVVLGNPPYVRMELISTMKPFLEKRYEVVSDRADLYCYFFERGTRLLKSGGRLGYISSATFFKTRAGGPLRSYLRRNTAIETMTNFGDLQIFDGVTTYPAIITLRRAVPSDTHEILFWNLLEKPKENFSKSFDDGSASYPQKALTDSSWQFEGDSLQRLRRKISDNKRTIKELFGSPLYGIKTGLNKAFVIDQAVRDELVAQDPRSSELLKRWLEGKDLNAWSASPRNLWIIYIPRNKVDIDKYPAIKAHLFPFKGKLEARSTPQKWFELQQAQLAYSPHFEAPCIKYSDITAHPSFSMDQSGSYLDTTGFCIQTNDEAVLAVLNSKVIWFQIAAQTPIARGGYIRFKTQYVENLRIPNLELQRERLAALSQDCRQITEERNRLALGFARRIPDLCPVQRRGDDGAVKLPGVLQNWWKLDDFAEFRTAIRKAFKVDVPVTERNDWQEWFRRDKQEVHRLELSLVRNEAEINSIVYALFDLTAEDISLLEKSI